MANTQRRQNGLKQLVSGSTSRRSRASSVSRTQILSDLWAKPVTKYVLGGIGIAVLSRLAITAYNKFYKRLHH